VIWWTSAHLQPVPRWVHPGSSVPRMRWAIYKHWADLLCVKHAHLAFVDLGIYHQLKFVVPGDGDLPDLSMVGRPKRPHHVRLEVD
jgi:hypothetical protein